jgi:hypothetical protein
LLRGKVRITEAEHSDRILAARRCAGLESGHAMPAGTAFTEIYVSPYVRVSLVSARSATKEVGD